MTKVWLKAGKEEKGREGGGYMTQLLESLEVELHRLLENDASIEECSAFIARIREELIRSFKNGLMKGRDRASGKSDLTRSPRRVR